MSDSGSPTATIDIAPYPPRATTPRPSSGSIARSTFSPPVPISVSVERPVRILLRADDDPAADRHLLERLPHARVRGFLRRVLVGPAEPARSAESGALGHARVALAQAVLVPDRRLRTARGRAPQSASPSCTFSTSVNTSSISSATARVHILILDHRHTNFPGAADDELLDRPDLVERIQILVE